jgi:hypothetical protein
LAHEINNPAAASLRAVEALRRTCDQMLTSLVRLAEKVTSAEQYVALDGLRKQLAEQAAVDDGAIATMDREEVNRQLARRSRHRRRMAARASIRFGGRGARVVRGVRSSVRADTLGPALQWISSTIQASSLLSELTDTTHGSPTWSRR